MDVNEILEKETEAGINTNEQINNILTAFSSVRNYHKHFIAMQEDLGEKASKYGKVFSTLFGIAGMTPEGQTRDMAQLQHFREFKDDFKDKDIQECLEGLEHQLETGCFFYFEDDLLKMMIKLLKNFKNLKNSY